MKDGNTCSRCGKERILLKTWKESVKTIEGMSELTYTQYVCPDAACQELVDKAILVQHTQTRAREQANLEREQKREELRKTSIANSRNKKK